MNAVVFDLDDTLLRDDLTISDFSVPENSIQAAAFAAAAEQLPVVNPNRSFLFSSFLYMSKADSS